MESKRNEAVDVEFAGNGEKGFTGEGDGRIERYEGRVRENARRLMEEVFKNAPRKAEVIHVGREKGNGADSGA